MLVDSECDLDRLPGRSCFFLVDVAAMARIWSASDSLCMPVLMTNDRGSETVGSWTFAFMIAVLLGLGSFPPKPPSDAVPARKRRFRGGIIDEVSSLGRPDPTVPLRVPANS
jgi:hypothetical protein